MQNRASAAFFFHIKGKFPKVETYKKRGSAPYMTHPLTFISTSGKRDSMLFEP